MKIEDLDIIEPGGDFFGLDHDANRTLRAPASDFTAFVGDILLTQEHPVPHTTGLYVDPFRS